MLINSLLLLSTILLITTFFIPHVSATPETLENNTTGNETNLHNSTIPAPSSSANNHTLINYTAALESAGSAAGPAGPSLEDFEYKNRVIP